GDFSLRHCADADPGRSHPACRAGLACLWQYARAAATGNRHQRRSARHWSHCGDHAAHLGRSRAALPSGPERRRQMDSGPPARPHDLREPRHDLLPQGRRRTGCVPDQRL
ncbi:MAG: hypothetical protein AVDCRST_MAG77-5976, partial [uncultured Chloroflexi bacterium]